jgi:hypothetical protein
MSPLRQCRYLPSRICETDCHRATFANRNASQARREGRAAEKADSQFSCWLSKIDPWYYMARPLISSIFLLTIMQARDTWKQWSRTTYHMSTQPYLNSFLKVSRQKMGRYMSSILSSAPRALVLPLFQQFRFLVETGCLFRKLGKTSLSMLLAYPFCNQC